MSIAMQKHTIQTYSNCALGVYSVLCYIYVSHAHQLTLSAHAREGYSSCCVCQCVTLSTSTRWQTFSVGNLHGHEEYNILFWFK